MIGFKSKLMKYPVCRALAFAGAALLVAGVPAVSQASVVATFDWVSYTTNTGQSPPTTPEGSFSVDLSSLTLTGGSYYTSGTAETATITALDYTFGDGLTVGLSNLNSTSIGSMVWSTSATVTPAFVTTSGEYLTSAFSVSGKADGGTFSLASSAGTAGTTTASGVTLASNGITPTYPPFSASDSGYWKLVSVAPVPLPATLPLLLAGLGLLALLSRTVRRRPISAGDFA